MAYRRESDAKLSHERRKHFSTPKAWPNTYFKEELSTFTNRVVRAENASAKYVTDTCGNFQNQEPAGTKPSSLPSSQMRCRPNSQKRSGADKGVEHIVLGKIYYAIRDDSDGEDVFLNPNERSLGGNSRHDESGERKTEESDRSFGGSNFNDSKEGQEENEFARTQTAVCERSNVRHKRTTKDVHGSLTKECEQPFQKGHNGRTVFHANQFAPSESRLHPPSLLRSASQVQGSPIFSDSPPRAGIGDYQGTDQNTSWEFPEVSSSDNRFQAQVHQDVNFQRRYPCSSTNTAHLSTVSKKKDGFVSPTWNRNASGNCTANGVASGCETSSSSSKSKEESGVNFVKLRNTVEQVVLEEIRRQMGNAGEAGEAQMLVRVAQDILSKAKRMGNCQTPTDIAASDNNPKEIVSPVGEEQSLSILTRQDHKLQSSTSAVDKARLSTMTSHNVNGEYLVVDFSREASKRRGQSLGDDFSDIVRPKYVRHESMPELRTNQRVSPDSRTDLYCSQEVMNSSRQAHGQQSEWNEQDIVVVDNTSSWRFEFEKQQDGQAEFRQDTDEEVEDTSSQRVAEELVGNVTNRKGSPPGSAFRRCHSNLNRADLGHARELCENSHQRSPSSDDCAETYRSSPSQSSQQSGHDPLHAEGDSFGELLDGLSGPTFSDDGYKFPASIFKRAQMMQQDRHATLRVFSTLFQPFSCSQSYTTTSHQNRASFRASHLTTCSTTQESQTSQKNPSVKEGSSGVSQEQQMECSSTHEDNGDQNVRIFSVCSLQYKDTYVQGHIGTPRSGLSEENASETSTIDKITENQTEEAAEDPPLCIENLSDDSKDTSTREEMIETQTAPAEDLPSCFENLIDNSQETSSREETTETQTGVAEDVFSSFENSSDNLKETSSDCDQSKRSQSSCSKCCNRDASLGCDISFPKPSKELLDSTRWSDTKLFVCPWLNCNMRFKRNDQLRSHWCMHTGEKPHPCPRCKKSFGRRDRLRFHMKTFHNLTQVDIMETKLNRSESIQR